MTSPTPAAPRRRLLAIGIGAVVLVALTVLGTLALTQRDDPLDEATPVAAAATSAAPESFGVRGSITLHLPGFEFPSLEDLRCHGRGGFDDIAPGASVVITDSTGATVALGQLGEGLAKLRADDPTRGESCTLTFDVPAVPAGKGFYGVAVGHRNAVQFNEARLRAEMVELTL